MPVVLATLEAEARGLLDRLGIAAVADRIILLDKGQIIEDGTHDELMKKHGFYSTLFETQTSLYTQ